MPDRRSELVAEHLPLVQSLARRYAGRGEPVDDLEQIGVIGLLKAIDRFDASLGNDLRAFAAPAILGEIRRHFRDRAWVVSVPRSIKDAYVAISQAVDALRAETGRTPTVAQLADFTGLGEDVVLDALGAGSAYRPASLAGPGSRTDGDDIDVPIDDAGIGGVIDRAHFDASIAQLPPLERRIVRLRFLDDLTQSQIGERLGLSQMHVSRLLRASLDRLRRDLAE